MKVAGNAINKALKFASALVVSACFAPLGAQSTAPYLLPYTIGVIAGGGTAPTAKGSCPAANGATALAADTYGDGCLASASSVSAGTDLHDVGVDAQGNIFYLDNGSTGVLRRIDARTGIVTVYAGSYGSSTTSCSTQVDKYGDGCLANDASTVPAVSGNLPGGNANGGYTLGLVKARGIAVAKNGDVYIADYSGNIIHKISASTGVMSVLVGVLSGTSAKSASAAATATTAYTGDGGLASAAREYAARGVAVDNSNNVYIADSSNNVIRMVNGTTGIISTFAGTGPVGTGAAASGFGGDNGPANTAIFATPEDVEVDANGNVYIGDFGNNRVRVVYQGGAAVAKLIATTNGGAVAQVGYIYTVVGSASTTAYTSGVVLATSVPIGNPRKIALDARGNLYIADNSYNIIWFVDITTGYMRPIAGQYNVPSSATATGLCSAKTDSFGDGCPATQATLLSVSAMGVAVDNLGNVLISDSGDARLREVYTNQSFGSVAAGASLVQTLQVHFGAGDNAAAANAFTITGNADFTVTGAPACTTNPDATTDCLINVTFKPTGPGAEKAVLTAASLLGQSAAFGISGVGTAAALAIDPGTTSTFASGLKTPNGIAKDSAGNTYIADTGNNRVVRYSISGTPTTIAGTGTVGYTGDNAAATLATLSAPKGVAVSRSGAVFIADTGNNAIRRIDPLTGVITTYGGTIGAVCTTALNAFGDGCLGTAAKFSAPTGIAADNDGNIYIADTGNNVIRELSTNGYSYLVSGGGTVCTANLLGATKTPDTLGNNCFATAATYSAPTGIAVDAGRNIYVADTGNNEVREILASSNYVTLIGGNGQAGFSGDGGAATGARVNGPTGVTVDAAGDVYVADTGNSAIRFINASGNMSTVVGTLNNAGTGTLPGLATAVQLTAPAGVVSSGAGTLTVLDSGNSRAFNVTRGSLAYTFNRTVPTTTSATLSILETATGSAPITLGSTLFASSGSTGAFSLLTSGTNGCTTSQILAPATTCGLAAQFTPPALGPYSASYVENTTPALTPAPSFQFSGTGALLTKTTSTTAVTVPATGNPQYAVSFTVQTSVVPQSCNTDAPSCIPTGTVTFYVNGTQVGIPATVSATGATSAVIGGQSVGTISVVAVYSGDGYYAASTAAALPVIIAQGATTTTVTATPSNGFQFDSIVLKATVKSTSTSDVPTGKISFYAGSKLLGTATTAGGVATIGDASNSFGLAAGSYQLQAQYLGDQNYAASTSTITLVINADVPTFVLNYNGDKGIGDSSLLAGAAAVGTAQGSTSIDNIVITPKNTLSGTMTFACKGMPVNSVCTFSPTSLTFTPTPLAPTFQVVQVTLWTDIAPGTNPAQTTAMNAHPVQHSSKTALATLLGWPVLMLSFVGMLGFRKRIRHSSLFTAIALFGLMAGSSVVMTGCFNAKQSATLTPIGVYNVTVVATGPQGTSASIPVTFTVSQGIAGQQ